VQFIYKIIYFFHTKKKTHDYNLSIFVVKKKKKVSISTKSKSMLKKLRLLLCYLTFVFNNLALGKRLAYDIKKI
jgi:hypothetical protein